MFDSYTRRKDKKSICRNNFSKFSKKSFSIFFGYRRRYEAMQNKSISKKREKGQVSYKEKE